MGFYIRIARYLCGSWTSCFALEIWCNQSELKILKHDQIWGHFALCSPCQILGDEFPALPRDLAHDSSDFSDPWLIWPLDSYESWFTDTDPEPQILHFIRLCLCGWLNGTAVAHMMRINYYFEVCSGVERFLCQVVLSRPIPCWRSPEHASEFRPWVWWI